MVEGSLWKFNKNCEEESNFFEERIKNFKENQKFEEKLFKKLKFKQKVSKKDKFKISKNFINIESEMDQYLKWCTEEIRTYFVSIKWTSNVLMALNYEQ